MRITASPDFENLTSIEFVKNGSVRGIINGDNDIALWIAPINSTFYLERRETLSGYMVYYGNGNFSFIMETPNSGYRNLAPWQIKKIPLIEVPEDGKLSNALNLSDYFADDTDSNLIFKLNYSEESGVYITLNGTWVNVDASTGEKNDNWNGWINVTVIVRDHQGGETQGKLQVYVYPVDDPPIISLDMKNNATITENRILHINVSDVDGDIVNVWYSIDNGAFISGKSISLNILSLGEGKHRIVVKASDGNLTSYENITFYVKIKKYNFVPAIAVSIILFAILVALAFFRRKKSEKLSV